VAAGLDLVVCKPVLPALLAAIAASPRKPE
jgi:hypothetical protein